MNTVLWIIQALLAVMFTLAGVMIVTQPKEKLAPKFPWVNDFSPTLVKFNGLSKLLGGIGLIIPMLTGIAPILTPVAAAGLCLIMVLAASYHIRKGEYKTVPVNIFLFALAAFVAYERF